MSYRLTTIATLTLALCCSVASAAPDEAKLVYKQAQDNAAANYKVARRR